ncbi:unnamed protein product [Didymodactylos carnosus]|uniref:Ubiquitin carboxyl-terminal hydrolase n=1 Tax=Didymodactylos carnosus TaxID=1234261 RepID=A0A813VRA1_9BILA|nr:unnamed protein product [Didymodactylos carnosus]CAF0853601.1 unnamed protein product [Didymodactylos carnosus]CAF3632898.1 unnamed protein product [Didymodactylos carnosus]CAF3638762.1 unnamed protein product [Didymodactylos carnosus]
MADLMFGDFSHEETEKFFGHDKQCVKFPWGADACINPTIEFGFDVPPVTSHVCSYYPSYHSSSCNGSSHQESSSALTSPPYSSKSSSVENLKISSTGTNHQKSTTNSNHNHHHHHRHSLNSAKKKKQRPKDYYAREYNQIMEPAQEQQKNGILNDTGDLSSTTIATAAPSRSTTLLVQSSSNNTTGTIDQQQHSEFHIPPSSTIPVTGDARLLACNQWVDSTMKHQQHDDDQESSKQSADLTNDEDEIDSDDTHGTTTDDNEDNVNDELHDSRSTTVPQTNVSYPINITQTNNNLKLNTVPQTTMKTHTSQQMHSLSPALNDDMAIYSTSVASGASIETLKPNGDQNNINQQQSSLAQSTTTRSESTKALPCWADLFRSSKIQSNANSNNLISPPSPNKNNNITSTTKSLSSASSSTSQPPQKKPSQQPLVRSSSGTQISSLTSQSMSRSTTTNDNRLYSNQSKNNYHVYNSNKEESQSLDDYFSKCELRPSAMAIKPRGLANKGNYCYINATLQALLACPPFFNVMKHAPISEVSMEQIMPCIEALHVFVNKFEKMDRSKHSVSANHKDIVCGQPFEATNMLNEIARLRKVPLDVVKTKQEDAHELLCQLLNELHEEICNVLYKTPVLSPNPMPNTEEQLTSPTTTTSTQASNVSQTNGNEEKSEDWLQVGKRNRTHVFRSNEIRKSLISEIFSGMFRSTVHSAGNQRSVVHEPFFTLSLEIKDNRIQSLEDALLRFSEQVILTDYVDNKTRQTVHTNKTMLIDQLPPILIIHLKCFLYDETDNSTKKINKQLSYQVNLTLPSKILTEQARKTSYDRYKLFAVEYHCGDKASGGHYITDVFHPGLQGWIRTDDSTVNVVTSSQVLNSQDNKQTPYLLFYRRGD